MIQVIESKEELKTTLDQYRSKGKKIAFVPTLGALHDGHASLVRRAKKHGDIIVASIFVNPTQFNESSDLEKYPRTFEADKAILNKNECQILFYPSVKTVYPNGMDEKPDIDLNGLDKVMEGAFRPGHFDGVVQVVKRLLDLVEPDFLMMGQKDFQQFSIIQFMINYFKLKTKLVVCPIKRESSGLAMSSRNVRLSTENREKAAIIYKTLNYVKKRVRKQSIASTIDYAMNRLTIPDFKPEYFSIVDGDTLQDVKSMDESEYVVACTAVWAGNIRLIDNKVLKNTKSS